MNRFLQQRDILINNTSASSSNEYQKAYDMAANPNTAQDFWREQAKLVDWYQFPKTILDSSNPPFYRWFKDGQINIAHNCIHRHAAVSPNQPAIFWESGMLNNKSVTYTYAQVSEQISKLAGLMQSLGVKKGDRVIIYMPMIPEGIFSMLACAHLGAIHSVVFGGFSAYELGNRIKDSKPALIICASCGYEPEKVINYKAILNDALQVSNREDLTTLLFQREEHPTTNIVKGRDVDYDTAMRFAKPISPVPVEGSHPLYILYTSGTTGQPKGIVRDQGGTAVALSWSMKHIMGIKKGEVYFSASDIGWVVGHSFGVYGPFLAGASLVVYEGKPTGTPNAGQYWRLMEKYKVNGFYTSPTGLRSLRKEDLNGDWIKKYDISSLHNVSMAGERCDVPTYDWIKQNLKVLINDNYWQTESGWPISCNYKNLHTFPFKAGSCTKPAPGYIIKIFDQDNNEIKTPGHLGRICIKLPLPPSFMLTIYNNEKAFIEKYLQETPGYYTSGDAGYFDEQGYLNVMTRLDDIINTAGHRLSTAQMEEVLLKHQDLVEAAVISKSDDLKGEIPIGLVVVKKGHQVNEKELEKDLIRMIRHEIGPVAAFRTALVVDKLPKTRSGKILRGTLKKMVEGEEFKTPATIEDASVLDKIKVTFQEYGKGLGQKGNLIYSDKVDQIAESVNDMLDKK